MARSTSSEEEPDPGRKESERQLHNTRTHHLFPILSQLSTDHAELRSLIEGNQSSSTTGCGKDSEAFLKDLDAILPKGRDWIAASNALLSSSSSVLRLYEKAERAVTETGEAAARERETYLQARAEERERVKGILLAGKRVCEGEVVGQGGKGNGEVMEIFGVDGVAKGTGLVEPERMLKYLDKGVRKMVKGMEV